MHRSLKGQFIQIKKKTISQTVFTKIVFSHKFKDVHWCDLRHHGDEIDLNGIFGAQNADGYSFGRKYCNWKLLRATNVDQSKK